MLVFVMHSDLDVLAAIVAKMRARGLQSLHAASSTPLVERAAKTRPAVLVIPERGENVEEAAELAALRSALPDVPEVFIPRFEASDEPAIARVVDAVTSAIAAASPGEVAHVGTGEIRGDLAQVPLPDLLQLLSMGRKTGTLSVATSSAAGEIRLADGEVVDAMFRRAEGMKAVIRLLGEREGAFHFAPDSAPALRRIREPMSSILMEGTRQVDEVRLLRERLGVTAGHLVALQVEDAARVPASDSIGGEVADLLGAPRTLDDLLDELPRPDLDVLRALARLDELGALRRLPIGDVRPSLAGPEGMVVLRGLARRLRPRGYRGPGRLVFVGAPAKVRLARQAVARLAEAAPGADVGSEMSADRLIEATATLQLGESVGLEIVTVIDKPELAPLFPLVLNGAIGVVTLDRPSPALAAIVEELEVALVDARSVVEDDAIDPGDPTSLASVVRGAIEGMGAT